MDGRFSVAIEDVQKVAIPVLRHRISTNFQAQAEGMSTEDMIQRLFAKSPRRRYRSFRRDHTRGDWEPPMDADERR